MAKVLLGVTGGIAAYKAALLVRLLRADGHEVRCACTEAAEQFVTPLMLEVLSGGRLALEDGMFPLPEGPGLGYTPDIGAVADLAASRDEVRL